MNPGSISDPKSRLVSDLGPIRCASSFSAADLSIGSQGIIAELSANDLRIDESSALNRRNLRFRHIGPAHLQRGNLKAEPGQLWFRLTDSQSIVLSQSPVLPG